MDALDLQEGHSFLNIGSGTGYISSIAAYLTGPTAINHNIELHEDVCAHARKSIDSLNAHLANKQREREQRAAARNARRARARVSISKSGLDGFRVSRLISLVVTTLSHYMYTFATHTPTQTQTQPQPQMQTQTQTQISHMSTHIKN